MFPVQQGALRAWRCEQTTEVPGLPPPHPTLTGDSLIGEVSEDAVGQTWGGALARLGAGEAEFTGAVVAPDGPPLRGEEGFRQGFGVSV